MLHSALKSSLFVFNFLILRTGSRWGKLLGVETVFLPLFVKKLPGKFEKYHRLFRNFHVWLRGQWFLLKKA